MAADKHKDWLGAPGRTFCVCMRLCVCVCIVYTLFNIMQFFSIQLNDYSEMFAE